MLRTLFHLNQRDVPLRVALRNTFAVVLPLAVGIATGHTSIGLGVAAGALNTMFSDQPGPYRLRMQRLLLTAFAAGFSAFVGGVLGGYSAAFVGVALLWGIAGGMLVALGPNAGRAGLTSMILLVITAAEPHPPLLALGEAALIFAGGLLQMLLAIAAWPLQRYRPERHALAGVCHQLARSARQRNDINQPPPVTQALLDVESLLHGAHRARGAAMETFRVLAEIVERIRFELLALGDLQENLDDREARATLARLREYAARTLDAIASALDSGSGTLSSAAALEGFSAARAALEERRAQLTDRRGRRLLTIAIARAHGLGGQLRAAARNADFAGSRGQLREAAVQARLPAALRPGAPLATLRANLRMSSVAFRHALRCGVTLAIAVAGERIIGLPHGYWVPMTAAIVLKPDFAGTFSFGLLRVAGTLFGLILTTALVYYAFGGAWERLAMLAVFSIGFRLLTTVHYGIGVMMLTGLVVILLSFYGVAPGETMLARGIATAIGSALALGAYALWPTWEKVRVRPALASMIEAYRTYFASLIDEQPTAHANARALARNARTNAQASIERLRGEPGRNRKLLSLAEGIFASANRFVRAMMSLEAVLVDADELPQQASVRQFGSRVDAALASIVDSLRHDRNSPIARLRSAEREVAAQLEAAAGAEEARSVAAAVGDACDRIADSVDTLAFLLDGKRPAASAV